MRANAFVGAAGGAIALAITFAAPFDPPRGQGQPALHARFESFVRMEN
jgi:hypothetical protein